MIQTPAFRNINIFFLIQTYGSYIYTVQKIILRPAGPRFITAMTGGGRWLQEGTQGEERGGQRGTPLLFFLSFLSGEAGYTHILREVSKVCTLFQIPSVPLRPQYTAPRTLILSHFHWIVTMHTHIQSITPFALSPSHSLPFTHIFPFFSCSLFRLFLRVTLPIFFSFFFFFSLFSHLHSRARSCLSCSHTQQHLNIVFSVIIKRNNDNI